MAEKQIPLALSGAEVRKALLYKIEQSLLRDCHLSDSNSYSGFSGDITIRLTLSDLGREVKTSHVVAETQGDVSGETHAVAVSIPITPEPVNKLRIETDQPVPVKTVEDGKTVIKNVRYQARKK